MACSRLFPPQLLGPGLDRLLVAVPESREVVCIFPLCSYVLHTTSILVSVCYIDHVDPSPVDYYQVRFEVTCRGLNKVSSMICTFTFMDASFLDTVWDVIVSSDFGVLSCKHTGLVCDPVFRSRSCISCISRSIAAPPFSSSVCHLSYHPLVSVLS
jgi:hypothetical protein